jgi:hypothetical protein
MSDDKSSGAPRSGSNPDDKPSGAPRSGSNPDDKPSGAPRSGSNPNVGWTGSIAHPDSPSGGAGPGGSKSPHPLGAATVGDSTSGLPHPLSPAGKLESWKVAAAATAPQAAPTPQPEPTVDFGPNTDKGKVSEYSLKVLKDVMKAAGVQSATIYSTARDAHAQARAMYDNAENDGADKTKQTYNGMPGEQVIDVYVASTDAKKTKEQIIADMEAKIKELGPGNVSKHCADQKTLNVFDVGPNSVTEKAKFIAAALAEKRVDTFLYPGSKPTDPAYHFQIPQP